MLGHASAAMTLDVYADLFDSDRDTVAASVGKMWGRAGLIARLFTPKNAPTSVNSVGGGVLTITCWVIDSARSVVLFFAFIVFVALVVFLVRFVLALVAVLVFFVSIFAGRQLEGRPVAWGESRPSTSRPRGPS